ncbi:hypothetical protein HMPREF7215_1914 [Pyramidobacter piscolens W5455]|uniref:Uncharacterized protein n=1 Tax=Pyramidobacter piscolens W5455 TaxID=352165 RepID=A0ABM9ZYM5_9BACT|nr:hypothetical protein HMPREF7215_1914 [Pyramidobacter piscolens W5455]
MTGSPSCFRCFAAKIPQDRRRSRNAKNGADSNCGVRSNRFLCVSLRGHYPSRFGGSERQFPLSLRDASSPVRSSFDA